ncbi:HPP family protein [Planktothrix sp. FACHB-1355]|nr:HPP family protein [Planktothrix sp. FACHB-1355]
MAIFWKTVVYLFNKFMRGYLPRGAIGSSYLPKLDRRKNRSRFRNRSSSAFGVGLPWQQILFSYMGGFFGIAALAYLSVATHYPLIMAPLGATSVLAFAVPDSPLAQPRNIIGGNCLAALVSLVCLHLLGTEPWVMAVAVGTAIGLMQLTGTVHPPAGAVALVAIMTHAEWEFLFTPVLAGSIVLVLCSVFFNNLVAGKTYPKQWF